MMKKIMKKLIDNYNAKQKAKQQRMNSEIICAIAWQVAREFEQTSVNIPEFMEVNNRYNSLGIKTPENLKEVYKDFFKQGLVSGIEL